MRAQICPIIQLFTVLTLAGCSERNHSNSEDQLNHLANATSPYLRQHADNPVDWYEWGPEALNKAKEENKPLIISIGYAACHWCHVMERESFMDTAVARMMNENFIAIKIDREERPDIDQIYLNAAQLISGRGGWPLNAFALPDGKPFFAATYFPREQWINLLKQVAEAYRNENENVIKQAQALTDGIQSFEAISPPNDESHTFDQKSYQNIFLQWQSFLDYENGGLTGAPKFPMPVSWEFLLQYNHLTGDKKAFEAVMVTLDEMHMGGIYDQLGGGFSRYSTDQYWLVPHFEKMLYDNGQLVSLYAHAYQQTGKQEYAKVIRETLEFIRLELTDSSGGFYSSINADSEHEEGKFYVWSKKEINDKLDPETAELFSQYFGITDSGNWENGKNILHKRFTREEFTRQNEISEEEWHDKLSNAKKILHEERSKRVRPSTDDKILTSWNAIMLNGYIDAYFALGNTEYLHAALKNAHFLDKNMVQKDGSLWRNYKDGTVTIAAFLDDYALLAKSFIRLYQATLDIYWLEKSKYIADYTIKHFRNEENGMFYYTSDQSENLIARKMELTDNVIPSSNSVFADVLYRLGEYYGQDSYIQMSKTMLNQVVKNIASGPYYANWAYLFGMVSYQPYEVAIMGEQALEKSSQLQRQYLPLAIFMGGEKENLPLLENKHVAGKTIIYVCRNKVCKLPVQTIEEAMQQLK